MLDKIIERIDNSECRKMKDPVALINKKSYDLLVDEVNKCIVPTMRISKDKIDTTLRVKEVLIKVKPFVLDNVVMIYDQDLNKN